VAADVIVGASVAKDRGPAFFTGKNNHASRQGIFELKKVRSLVVVMIGVETWKRFCRLCLGAEQRVMIGWQIVRTEENLVRTARSPSRDANSLTLFHKNSACCAIVVHTACTKPLG
jgi:hypothetical protein